VLTPHRTARDLRRAREIASVLLRHGLADVARRSGVSSLWRALRPGLAPPLDQPERVRRALEDLGPTFVKLGQLLAGRSDILPPEWTRELARLREEVRPEPWERVREQLAEDLGGDPEQVFADLEREAMAAGSIAQVHRARLADGTRVVLKVRRPGIREVVEDDLRLLARLARRADESSDLGPLDPARIVRELSRAMQGELDLRAEARHGATFARNLAHRPEVVVPRVHERWTRERLLVLDYVEGPSAASWLAGDRSVEVDPVRVARLGAEIVLEMILDHGFYHSDPHQGNVLFLPGDRIALLDFGQVGRLGERRRAELERMLAGIAGRDGEAVVGVLLGWTRDSAEPGDPEALREDCGDFIERWRDLRLEEIDLSRLLADVAHIVRENGLRLPGEVALLIKTLATLDEFGRALDPGFRMASVIESRLARTLAERASPLAALRAGLRGVTRASAGLPNALSDAMAVVRRGRLGVRIEVSRLDAFNRQIDRSANRLTIGMVTAALIVGTAISLTIRGGPELLGLPVFGLLGFVSSTLAGVVLVAVIYRSHHL
jgi:ubiquinone biosynthesis protein